MPLDATGIFLKLDRARHHIRELEAALAKFNADNELAIATRRDVPTRCLVYYLANVPTTPPSIALLAGDAIHSMRTSLDHLTFHMYREAGGMGEGRDVKFPVSERAGDHSKNVREATKGLEPAAIDALSALEAFPNGKGHELWVLHKLNNIDKHRYLLTVPSALHSVDLGHIVHRGMNRLWKEHFGKTVVVPAPSIFFSDGAPHPAKVGEEIFRSEPDAVPDYDLRFAFGLLIHEPPVVEGALLIDLLIQLVEQVEGVIGRFYKRARMPSP